MNTDFGPSRPTISTLTWRNCSTVLASVMPSWQIKKHLN